MTAAVCFTAAVSGAYAFPQQSHSEPEGQPNSEPEGDTIRYHVSAGTGYHMAIGFIRSKELSPTYFTENNDRSQGILKATGGFEVPADLVGTYTLFVQACDGELTDVKGTVEIGKIADNSAASDEIVTSIPIEIPVLSELTFAWLGEYDFAYGDRIQYHISAEAGSGFTGLTMNDPDAKVKGLFGYADGAKIYNVTLRDYDIANGGFNSGQESTAPVLAFGTDTECYDNFLYPRE